MTTLFMLYWIVATIITLYLFYKENKVITIGTLFGISILGGFLLVLLIADKICNFCENELKDFFNIEIIRKK